MPEPLTFVSYTNDRYYPGLLCLYKSLRLNGGFDRFEFVVMCRGLSEARRVALEALPGVSVEDLDRLDAIAYDGEIPDVKRFNLNKLHLFALPGVEKAVYLDADVVCVSDVTALREIEPIAMVPNLGERLHPPVGQRVMFNSGVMVVRTSEAIYDGLRGLLKSITLKHFADQALINEYLSQEGTPVESLHPAWNLIVSNKQASPALYRDVWASGVKFLHYTKIKPWFRADDLRGRSVLSTAYLRARHRAMRLRYKWEVDLWHEIDDALRLPEAERAAAGPSS